MGLAASFTTTSLAAEHYVDGAKGSATGTGSAAEPFATMTQGLSAAMPGDTVIVRDGVYEESPATARDGTASGPITVRAENSRQAVLTSSGNVLTLRHAHHVIEGLVIDGKLGSGRTVRLRDNANHVELRDLEIRNSGNNCVDLGVADDVLIEQSAIHHCLRWSGGGPSDAHGITGDAPTNLTVRDTEISFFSGDAFQFSPSRQFWDKVLIERTRMWIAPLPEDAGDFKKGEVYGENAFDSKTPKSGARPRVTFRDVVAHGFRGFIGNQSAFNVKENVDFLIDGATVYDSELAFRMRGPAKAVVRNVVAYGNDASLRYEDGIENLTFQNVTFVDPMKDGGGADPVGLLFENALFLAEALPAEASAESSNMAADASFFVDTESHDYHLVSDAPAIDAGKTIAELTTDREGVMRPSGAAYDVGAYEWTDMSSMNGAGAGGSSGETAASGAGASSSTAGGGAGTGGDEPLPTDAGCSCRHARGSGGSWWLLLALAPLLRSGSGRRRSTERFVRASRSKPR